MFSFTISESHIIYTVRVVMHIGQKHTYTKRKVHIYLTTLSHMRNDPFTRKHP